MAAGLLRRPAELRPFREQLASGAAAQRELARGLRSARFSRLTGNGGTPSAGRGRRGQPTAARLAAARIAGRIGGCSPTARDHRGFAAESLHELRKRCKELRYLLEIFGSLYDPGRLWQAVRELKALQDCLGEFQDTEVQRPEIRAFAAQMMAQRTGPAATLLAMGEVAAGLAAGSSGQDPVRRHVRDFAGPASQARIQAMPRRPA